MPEMIVWGPSDPKDSPVFQAGSKQNIEALKAVLAGWRCCGAPQLCGARCQEDPLSAALALAEQEVRSAG